ncbi:MAG TPA: hypothetical protein VFS60_12905, partial [Thermoanaerobaculia bacterium]|nr:hypothetical protein [Thermoanaerobaculia bacterium]
MAQQIAAELKELLLSATFRPAVTLWNRLEGRPRQVDFDRSLRAEIRDPLWMLTRQWQLGELNGEDAGSAAKARVQVDTARLDRFAVKAENREATGGEEWQPAVGFDPEVPLEVQVEREPLWKGSSASTHTCLAWRGQMGSHWVRLLRHAGLDDLKGAFVDRFGFEDLAEGPAATPAEQLATAQVESAPAAWQVLATLRARLPDGRRLLAAIEDDTFDAWVEAAIAAGRQQTVKDLGRDFRSSFYRVYSQPDTAVEDAWAPSYLEYQFAVSAPADDSEAKRTLLVAEQYHQGLLDWYSFEVDPAGRLEDLPGTPPPAGSVEARPALAVIPTQIEFNGMPNVRWWELEDRRTSFGNISAGTTDVPLLLLAEFGLVYGNDWSVIPYNLPVGTLAEIKGLIVTDVFGVRTLIRPAGQGQGMDWQEWSMYGLSSRTNRGPADRRLLLAPAVAKSQEGDPLEKVVFARDEMSNLVWGVEERIPGVLGTGVDGFEAATALSRHFRQRVPEGDPEGDALPPAGDAGIRYQLGTTVPENWIPFIAARQPGSQRLIRLQRAAMPRLTDALPGTRVEPRGEV